MVSKAGAAPPCRMYTVYGRYSFSREVLAIAIGAGAIAWTQVTDSLFWIVKKYLGLSLTETLRNYTVPTTIASLVGLGAAFALNSLL